MRNRTHLPTLLSVHVAIAALAGCGQAAEPRAEKERATGEYAQRHMDFSRLSVHLVGAVEGFRFARVHELEAMRFEFAENVVDASRTLLERHEGFPPHPAALEKPDDIAGWQEAMARVRTVLPRIEDTENADTVAESVDRIIQAYREAGEHSGYPAGTIAFLEWRGVHKMARDMDPELRSRFAEEIVELLEKRRDRFVAERRELVTAAERDEFDERVETLLRRQVESVRKAGPIPDSTAYILHEHYPYFHQPAVLEGLLERKADR